MDLFLLFVTPAGRHAQHTNEVQQPALCLKTIPACLTIMTFGSDGPFAVLHQGPLIERTLLQQILRYTINILTFLTILWYFF